MKQTGGTYVSVDIAASHFAVNVYLAHLQMGLDFKINGPRDVKFFLIQLAFTTSHLYNRRIILC